MTTLVHMAHLRNAQFTDTQYGRLHIMYGTQNEKYTLHIPPCSIIFHIGIGNGYYALEYIYGNTARTYRYRLCWSIDVMQSPNTNRWS